MVFCCGPVDNLTQEEQYVVGNKNAFPTQRLRQFKPTNGNALIAGSPPANLGYDGEDLVSVTVPEGVSAGQTIAVLAPDGSRLVKATIPAGLKSGETFLVRLAIPIRDEVMHSQPIPPPTTSKHSQPQFAQSLDTWTTPIDQPVPGITKPIVIDKPVYDPTQPSFVDALDRWLTPVPDTQPMNDNNSVLENTTVRDEPPLPEPIVASIPIPVEMQSVGKAILIQDELPATSVVAVQAPPVGLETNPLVPVESESHPSLTQSTPERKVQQVSGLHVNAHIESAETKPLETDTITASSSSVRKDTSDLSTVSNQKLLLVQVPPGLPAGASMQVEIPGENRTLAAIVPPGAETFHIAYTPRIDDSGYSMPSFSGPPVPLPKSRTQSPKGQKLLLVRVPPGTTAGTTLHVSVPDEPGRILAAQVPPGNVQEFHVSYEARPRQQLALGHINTGSGITPPVNAYNNNHQQYYHHHQPQHHPSMMQPGYYHPMNNDNYQQINGANYWLPTTTGMVGGAEVAAASMGTYEQQQYRDDVDNNNSADYGVSGGKEYELTDL